MRILTGIVLALVIALSTQVAHASDGESEIQRIEHALNSTLSLPRPQQVAVIEKFTNEILELVSRKEITPDRAEFALAFINRLV